MSTRRLLIVLKIHPKVNNPSYYSCSRLKKKHVAKTLHCTLHVDNTAQVNDTGDTVRVQTSSNKHEEGWEVISTEAKIPEKFQRVSR